MQHLSSQLLSEILFIAEQAGEHLKSFYHQSLQVTIKSDKTPVTDADLFISQFISEKLAFLTPNIPIVSEENCYIPLSDREKWQEYWIIDPLDGTQQFIDRTDQFSVVISLVQHNRPVLGVIHAPILGKTYYAMVNQGAFLIEKGKCKRLHVSEKCFQSIPLHITIGTSNSEKIRQAIRNPYQIMFLKYGSSSLKAGLVAEGNADCYIRLGDTGEWDTAAAEIILAESGGTIFDLQFSPLTYNQRDTYVNPSFIMVGNKQYNWLNVFDFN